MAQNLPYKHEGSKKTNNPSLVHGRKAHGAGWGQRRAAAASRTLDHVTSARATSPPGRTGSHLCRVFRQNLVKRAVTRPRESGPDLSCAVPVPGGFVPAAGGLLAEPRTTVRKPMRGLTGSTLVVASALGVPARPPAGRTAGRDGDARDRRKRTETADGMPYLHGGPRREQQ